MRRRLAALCLIPLSLMLGSTPASANPPVAELREPDLAVKTEGRARIHTATLPGRVLSTVVDPAGGGLAILATSGQPDGPRVLYRLDLAGSLVQLADGLPTNLETLAILELRAGLEIVASEPGWLYSLGALGDADTERRARLLLQADGLDLERARRYHPSDAYNLLLQPQVGRLDVVRWNGNNVVRETWSELPVRAQRRRNGLELSTPQLHHLPGPSLLAIGPEAHGKRRLLTTLVDLSGPILPSTDDEEEPEPTEAWAELPANERIAQSWYAIANGRPILIVATLDGDKIGIFEKLELRAFPLRTDRTRAGARPLFHAETETRNWYDIGIQVADFDGDGRDDLLTTQPEGLGAKKLAFVVYPGRGGGFTSTPRRSVITAPEADWILGYDFDDDGTPDLATFENGVDLKLFRGLAQHRKQTLDKKPYWDLDLPAAEVTTASGVSLEITVVEGDAEVESEPKKWRGDLEAVDIDGDGRPEVLLSSGTESFSILRIVSAK